mgnify:CR=1 FL=1
MVVELKSLEHINISSVTPRDLSRMIKVLEKQGQIEPLQLSIVNKRPFVQDPHGISIVAAARQLNWPTILVIYTERYEE